MLKNMTAMTAEREALSMSAEHLMILFPLEAKDFQLHTKYIVRRSLASLRSP